MLVRTATNLDIPGIKLVVFSVLEEYGLKRNSATDRDLESIEEHYSHNEGFFAVVEDKESIVATVGLRKVDATTCELRKMYILPHHRGKGLGKQLLDMAITKARELAYHRITLETASVLKEAIGLYNKYGFKPVSSCHLSSRCDQAYELLLDRVEE